MYSDVVIEQDQIYKFDRYSIIKEYYYKPILPPPFSFFYFILIRMILQPIRKFVPKKEGKIETTCKRLFYYLSDDYKNFNGFILSKKTFFFKFFKLIYFSS